MQPPYPAFRHSSSNNSSVGSAAEALFAAIIISHQSNSRQKDPNMFSFL
jgi:hypothetical protein